MSSSAEFGRFMTTLPESLALKSVTLQAHNSGTIGAGTQINILDFDKNLLITSKPLVADVSNQSFATFEFEKNDIQIHRNQIYWIQFTVGIAAKVGDANVKSTDGTHTFTIYYSGGQFPRQIFIAKIEFYTYHGVLKGFVM